MQTWRSILASLLAITKATVGGVVQAVSRQPYMLDAQLADGTSVTIVVPVPLIATGTGH